MCCEVAGEQKERRHVRKRYAKAQDVFRGSTETANFGEFIVLFAASVCPEAAEHQSSSSVRRLVVWSKNTLVVCVQNVPANKLLRGRASRKSLALTKLCSEPMLRRAPPVAATEESRLAVAGTALLARAENMVA